MRTRPVYGSAIFTRILSVVLLAMLAFSAVGCGSGPFGLGTEEDEKKVVDEKASDARVAAAGDEKSAPADTVLQYEAQDRVLIWKAGNDGGIEGGGGTPPQVIHDSTYYVVEVATYHAGWGPDAPDPSGTIALKAADGTVYGPWETTVQNKSYWIATPNMEIPAGTYTLVDSDPSTWAQNSASGGTGMGWAYGVVPQ